jgi:hypothetical protein
MALWMDWRLVDGDDEDAVVSGGPREAVAVGRQVSMLSHQSPFLPKNFDAESCSNFHPKSTDKNKTDNRGQSASI